MTLRSLILLRFIIQFIHTQFWLNSFSSLLLLMALLRENVYWRWVLFRSPILEWRWLVKHLLLVLLFRFLDAGQRRCLSGNIMVGFYRFYWGLVEGGNTWWMGLFRNEFPNWGDAVFPLPKSILFPLLCHIFLFILNASICHVLTLMVWVACLIRIYTVGALLILQIIKFKLLRLELLGDFSLHI